MTKSMQELIFQLNKHKTKEKVIIPCHIGVSVPGNAIPIRLVAPSEFLHRFPNPTFYSATLCQVYHG